MPNFFAAARFSLRRCLSVFCGAFLASFFGLSALFKDSSFRSLTVRGMYYSCWRMPASASRRSSVQQSLRTIRPPRRGGRAAALKPVSLTPLTVRYHQPSRAAPRPCSRHRNRGGALAIEKAAQRAASQRATVQASDQPFRRPRSELRCASCSYGAIAALPIRCPMCGGDVWDFVDWRPFVR